ncbi:FAD:protein FMN transferase [Enhygromyxa salina]|uniref:FAD:protein FMN transferase n=1 Tax=Enhygromyxa salina TaxID=215803 RepID=A0A2S9YFX1_9BACT|nr:FAD:protein FMN transferase [Enhygromyxa salina]PRQ03952.1 Thiamine biosynthesis lipoprotein ApbE precursor [Enhygromyxa salina]
MSEQSTARAKGARSPASIVLIGLLGLAGMIYLIWPRQPAVERGAVSDAGSAWELRADKAVLGGVTMGTTFSVVIAGDSLKLAPLERLQAQIDAELQAVNAEMSTYLPDSELSRFNAASAREPFHASAHLLEVVGVAKQINHASGGAFDVTVGPLVDAWGFGPDPGTRTELSDVQIAALRERVGDTKLELDPTAQTLRKTVDGLHVDLSAIAKGHGADRVAAQVEAAGYSDYMIEVGGEVRVRGSNPAGEPWRVGIERPTADAAGSRAVQAILPVRDVAVATSGDYRNYWERDGVRYSHTIDPRTGRPITHRLASVTVVHPESAALADGWATALNVLGPEQGLALAEQLGLAAYFLVRTDQGFEVRTSSAYAVFSP